MNSDVSKEPLSAGDQAKLLLFVLAMLPTVAFGIGVLPAVFLCFGIFMMKRSGDFRHVRTAARNTQIYLIVFIVAALALSLIFAPGSDFDKLAGGLSFAVLAAVYMLIVDRLFCSPLRAHAEWVEKNGIFATRPRGNRPTKHSVNIKVGSNSALFSVADELAKWAKLKEDGLITQDEFDAARRKLLYP